MSASNLSRLFENRITYATLLLVFVLATSVNMVTGGTVPVFGKNPAMLPGIAPVSEYHATSSELAVSPATDSAAVGEENSAPRSTSAAENAEPKQTSFIGPIPPPNPWDADAKLRLAIGTIPPPNPWDADAKLRLAIGPIPPPNPWDDDFRIRNRKLV